MPSLPRTEVDEIAFLARLHLDEAELVAMETDLGAILETFGALAAVDTQGVPPMTHAVPEDSLLRADVVGRSLPVDEALAMAPRRHGDVLVVPAIITAGSGIDS